MRDGSVRNVRADFSVFEIEKFQSHVFSVHDESIRLERFNVSSFPPIPARRHAVLPFERAVEIGEVVEADLRGDGEHGVVGLQEQARRHREPVGV